MSFPFVFSVNRLHQYTNDTVFANCLRNVSELLIHIYSNNSFHFLPSVGTFHLTPLHIIDILCAFGGGKLTPTVVNMPIQQVEVFESVKIDGVKHVSTKVYCRTAAIIEISDKKGILKTIKKMRTKPLKTA